MREGRRKRVPWLPLPRIARWWRTGLSGAGGSGSGIGGPWCSPNGCPRTRAERTGGSNPGGRSWTFEATEEVRQHVSDVSGRRRRFRTDHAWFARRQVLIGRFTDTDQRYLHLRSAALVLNRLRNPVVVGRRFGQCERVVNVGDWLENARPLESLDIELLTLDSTAPPIRPGGA